MQTDTFFCEDIGDRPFQAIYRPETHGSVCVIRDLNDRVLRVIRSLSLIVYYPRSVMYLDGV